MPAGSVAGAGSAKNDARLASLVSENEQMATENRDLRNQITALEAQAQELRKRIKDLELAEPQDSESDLERERAEVEQLRQAALEAMRRLQNGDASVLTDEELARELAEPVIYVLGDEEYLEMQGPQGIATFYGDDLLFIPDEGRVLIGKSEEIARDFQSEVSEEEAFLRFKNDSEASRYVFWIDFEGKPRLYKSLKPGEEYSTKTYMGHQWVVTDNAGTPLGELEPIYQSEFEEIIVE